VDAGLLLWTSIPYLLMNRQVHWRRVLVDGAILAIVTSLYGVATTIYTPSLLERYTNEFGLFGITIAIIGWLLAVSVGWRARVLVNWPVITAAVWVATAGVPWASRCRAVCARSCGCRCCSAWSTPSWGPCCGSSPCR
jgi:membrane protein